jgi:hypothetical protein
VKLWQGGWVFADTRSAFWPYVEGLWLRSVRVAVERKDYLSYQDEVGKVLGYPVRFPRQEKFNTVKLVDLTESHAIANLSGQAMIVRIIR